MTTNNSCEITPCVLRSKTVFYSRLLKQLEGLVSTPCKHVAGAAAAMINLSNAAAFLFYELNEFADPQATLQSAPINWFGFYLVHSSQMMALGPFQGRPACTEIKLGSGVCGTSALEGKTHIVADVHKFSGHIACDSASNSEIVVPIKDAAGRVVAVIDVDSTQLSFFDDDDAQGLQGVADILMKHVDFSALHGSYSPATSAAGDGLKSAVGHAEAIKPATTPSASLPSSTSPAPTDGNTSATANSKTAYSAAAALSVAGLTTQLTQLSVGPKLSAFTITPAAPVSAPPTQVHPPLPTEPRSWSMEICGWKFSATEFTRILTQEELKQYENELGTSSIPEIQFAFNTLQVTPVARHSDTPLMSFSLKELLRSAVAFYKTDSYRLKTAAELVIPVSESWKETPYAVFDARVDWAWRNNFFGLNEAACALRPLEPTMPGFNWDLLRDQTLPILFFHNFDMLEDDLHDHGVVRSSVRIRAMPTAFFILLRHFIRVDHYRIWIRDVRIFHQYDVRRESGEPHVVVREEVRLLDIEGSEEWYDKGADEYAQLAKIESEQEYFVSFSADPAGNEWWSTVNVK
uniref:Uncharacterized protein TCIL3000_5_1230 n=1 Tax=Trypanosoma congolense (strain IL3000) TaxID=1068625 RepID=G0UML5_TRYCI|nr:unnamed protein product [Trypanosoma congolense IL3000]